MPLKTLVAIILRFFALGWLIAGFSSLLTFVPMIFSESFFDRGLTASFLLMPLAMFLGGALLWAGTSRLSIHVTKGHDMELIFSSLTREDLYRFAFVFLGLYFMLNEMQGTLKSVYEFFAIGINLEEDNPKKGSYFAAFFIHAIPLLAGFICVFGARSLTGKLIRLENKNENPTATTPTT